MFEILRSMSRFQNWPAVDIVFQRLPRLPLSRLSPRLSDIAFFFDQTLWAALRKTQKMNLRSSAIGASGRFHDSSLCCGFDFRCTICPPLPFPHGVRKGSVTVSTWICFASSAEYRRIAYNVSWVGDDSDVRSIGSIWNTDVKTPDGRRSVIERRRSVSGTGASITPWSSAFA